MAERARPLALVTGAAVRVGAGTVDDVAGAVRFLAAASHVTGHIMVVDGGMSVAL